MTRQVLLFLVISMLFLSNNIFSQKKPIKFGKISKAELEMQTCDFDSAAHAMILADIGYAELVIEPVSQKILVDFQRTVRFKILDKGGYEYADFRIPVYKSGSDEERITKFKGKIYNLESGKIVEAQVGKKDLLFETTNDYLDQAKIAMPQVKEGTVFEITYSVQSPFFWNLHDWQFQYQIPVKYSDFEILYPEWFVYDKKYKGYDFDYLTVNEETSDVARVPEWDVDYRRIRNLWVVEKMPAFKVEPFVATHKNYLFTIDFELSATRMPNQIIKSYVGNWEEIGTQLMKSSRIGGMLAKGKIKSVKEQTELALAGKTEPMEKIVALQHYVSNNVSWNGYSAKYASQNSPAKVLDNTKGNSADINLLLTAMLKAADFNASPVVLSTRQHGFLNQFFPSDQQFNYLITGITMPDGNIILLDATDKTFPAGLLPPKCINDKGLMIAEEGSQWVNLNPTGSYRTVTQYNLSLNDNLEWEGDLVVKCKDYAARTVRATYAKQEDEKAYLTKLENEHSGLTINEASFENLGNIYKETVEKYEVSFADQLIDAGDMLYFNPLLTFAETENPFKAEERKYPVDFNYPQTYVFSASFDIPEGYVVEELPEQLVMSLPERGGKFIYNVKVVGDKINLTNQIQISKHLYLMTEYGGLREFYNLMVEKHGAQVVLKKKT